RQGYQPTQHKQTKSNVTRQRLWNSCSAHVANALSGISTETVREERPITSVPLDQLLRVFQRVFPFFTERLLFGNELGRLGKLILRKDVTHFYPDSHLLFHELRCECGDMVRITTESSSRYLTWSEKLSSYCALG